MDFKGPAATGNYGNVLAAEILIPFSSGNPSSSADPCFNVSLHHAEA